MTTRLVVNADDFGLTRGVSSAIISAAQHGIVTSTTALMNTANALEDLRRAARAGAPTGLGVHLNVTFGRPLCDPVEIPSLVDSSAAFTSLGEKLQRPDLLEPDEIRREWTRQIEAFLSTGIELDHLDSHHFAAALSHPIWEVYLQLAGEFQCGARPLPGSTSELSRILPTETWMDLDPSVWNRTLRDRQIAAPDRLLTSFYKERAQGESLLSDLTGLGDGWFELVCHPGFDDRDLRCISGYTQYRQQEYDLLSDSDLRGELTRLAIALVTYRTATRP